MKRKKTTVAALLLAVSLAWPLPGLAAQGTPEQGAPPGQAAPPERYQTPLGTFELDPQVRQQLHDLRATLNETAKEISTVLKERVKLTPEEKERLNRMLDQLRQQLHQLESRQASRI